MKLKSSKIISMEELEDKKQGQEVELLREKLRYTESTKKIQHSTNRSSRNTENRKLMEISKKQKTWDSQSWRAYHAFYLIFLFLSSPFTFFSREEWVF